MILDVLTAGTFLAASATCKKADRTELALRSVDAVVRHSSRARLASLAFRCRTIHKCVPIYVDGKSSTHLQTSKKKAECSSVLVSRCTSSTRRRPAILWPINALLVY